MRAVTWLHISDFHLRERHERSQKTVLSAMLDDIERRCSAGLAIDFVLATGDLAFSGDGTEYDLATEFFAKLSTIIELSCKLIYCVPGNHDVQRERYKTLFYGARQKLKTENDVYAFLTDTEERETLLLRQGAFSNFQERVFATQERQRTTDNLGYVSNLEINDLRIAIIGLNSSWLSEGGDTDERQLVLGEHQVIDAIDIAASSAPHIIIGMQHHPFDYLKRFDQQATQRRIEDACLLFHCGHLHQPDATQAVTESGNCLKLAAGASYESRNFHNAYSIVTFDPLRAESNVTFVQYSPGEGEFCYESRRSYLHEIGNFTSCTTIELATSIESYCEDAVDVSHYLASLLLGHVADVPIEMNGRIAFGAAALMSRQDCGELSTATYAVLGAGRAIRLLYGQKSLHEILVDYGAPVRVYVAKLRALGTDDKNLWDQIVMRNIDAANLAGIDEAGPYRHTLRLLDDLLAQGDWDELMQLGERCCKISDPVVATKAKRAVALCLARHSEDAERLRAICYYRAVIASEHGEAADWAALATLLEALGSLDEAKSVIMEGIGLFPEKIDGFTEVGMRVVTASGDIDFRNKLREHRRGEESR